MTHKCRRNGCPRQVREDLELCEFCWKDVPIPLREVVNAAYAGGAGRGSAELLAAQEDAVRAVNGEPGPGGGRS